MKKNKTKEIWVPAKYIRTDGTVLDFTSKYEVSSLGRVRSLNYNHTGKTKVKSQFISKDPYPCGTMYYQVHLYLNKRSYCLKVHRLVLSSFDQEGGSPNDVVDHIVPRTSTSCDNRLSNLRWFSARQNSSTVRSKALRSKACTNHPSLSKRVKVTFSDGTHRVFPSANEAERALGIPHRTLSTLINKYNGYYKKLNLHFEYVK